MTKPYTAFGAKVAQINGWSLCRKPSVACFFVFAALAPAIVLGGQDRAKLLVAGALANDKKPKAVAKESASAAKIEDSAKKDRRQTVWNLTFLPSNLPEPGDGAHVDFASINSPASELATALQNAYNAGLKDGDENKVNVTAVGNSLVLEGESQTIDDVRRLLATQLDVPQSQIILELDAFQVSANAKSREAANRSVRRLMLAEEMARIYKLAHLQAAKIAVMNQAKEIDGEIAKRSQLYGLSVPKLFRQVGLDPSAKRVLGQNDLLFLLAYCPTDTLMTQYPAQVSGAWVQANAKVESTILGPLKNSRNPQDQEMALRLQELNDDFKKAETRLMDKESSKGPRGSSPFAVLRTFAEGGDLENEATRRAIEEFFLLWAATADRDCNAALSKMEKDAKVATLANAAKLASDEQLRKEKQESKKQGSKELSELTTGIYEYLYAQYGEDEGAKSDEVKDFIVRTITGDRPAKLVRCSATIDDLIRIGMEALQSDSDALVDGPLQAWIDSRVVRESQNAGFAVRFGGATKMTVTSRVPGLSGTQADTFFPYQPTAPIDLNSLLPVLSRKPVPPAEGQPTDLAAAGLTPQETLVLQGIFDQASKEPYQKKLATGINLAVAPTVLGNGSSARLQLRLSLSVQPDANDGGAAVDGQPAPVDLIKSSVVETEMLVNAFDIGLVSSFQLDVSAPGKRDWQVPILSQILPIRSWFVGPTQDKTVRHEALVLVKVMIIPRAMDVASRFLNAER